MVWIKLKNHSVRFDAKTEKKVKSFTHFQHAPQLILFTFTVQITIYEEVGA